ncbi:hypothetical protein HYV49_03245 [Candidatus Pacearchaeota archaeon]|nr:hypothetical protein [Candidatus Pacearchaeota archaeon]
MNRMRIAFGLCNTLMDVYEENYIESRLRPGAVDLLKELKRDGHILILWTSLKKRKVNFVKALFKDFFKLFNEIYCYEDFDLLEKIPDCSEHQFKNIERISADCLIESKKNYREYSNNLSLSKKYLIIDKYRECLYRQPSNWKIRVLGEEVFDAWQKRIQNREEWVYDVLSFVDKMSVL